MTVSERDRVVFFSRRDDERKKYIYHVHDHKSDHDHHFLGGRAKGNTYLYSIIDLLFKYSDLKKEDISK